METVALAVPRRGQRHLGEGFFGAAAPGSPQVLEPRAVVVSRRRQLLVDAGQVELLGTGWWPLAEPLAVLGPARSHHAARVPHPLPSLLSPLHPRLTPAALVALPHPHSHPDPGSLAQHQRTLQRQLLHLRAPDLLSRPQRQLHEHRPRHHRSPAHPVLPQPLLAAHRQPPAHQHAVHLRHLRHHVHQRVLALSSRTPTPRPLPPPPHPPPPPRARHPPPPPLPPFSF